MKYQYPPERLLNDQYMDSLTSFRMYQHTLNVTIDTHWHQFFELGLVASGNGIHEINGIPHRIERGHAFLLTPTDFHRIVPDPGQTVQLYNLIFTERMISDELTDKLFECHKNLARSFESEEYEDAEREFERILRESSVWREHSGIIVKGCIERLLIDLSRGCLEKTEQRGIDISVHPSIRKAIVYLQNHFREPILMEEVARLSGLSANYFSESFSKQTGITFQAYVRDLRLQFAKSLIRATGLPITEICYASGFNTLAYFERAFKTRYQMSPRNMRHHSGTV
ncbi:AraC family transcriptional regulator [Paenibacillus guangzhouensis]|uniref:AraC family transcriptional regulator n=1 Tax=Paenibacillus guangzhouensis TaxID=1473112 RepID=UPI00126737DF|nr:AraC family transcriptional regulator [Paenibacillus guangzhouensis]